MRKSIVSLIAAFAILISGINHPAFSQKKGMKTINKHDLYTHLSFIASDELQGRNTPSKELKIAARYLASHVAGYGLKPIMPDGSYFQDIPLEITTISESQTNLSIISEENKKVYSFQESFRISSDNEGVYSGEVVFVGGGVNAPDLGWDDYAGMNIEGKFVIHVDGDLPDNHPINRPENRGYLYNSYMYPRSQGALGIISIIDEDRENNLRERGIGFDNPERGEVIWNEDENNRQGDQPSSDPQRGPYINVTIRHSVAAEILGISENELIGMFEMIRNGHQVPGRELNKTIEIKAGINKRRGLTRNVVAVIEGSDKKLKDEYIVIGSHYDHVGAREGKVNNGADDDGSGTVAMLEIAQALSVERPKRSVILVWHTGEEKGLWGGHWFVANSPVPLQNISAVLQMDMISRNDPDSIYVIGSHFLSSELDEINNDESDKRKLINLSHYYNDPNMRRNYHRNSDHYAYHLAGIPTIFYFCGVHEDLHSPTDTIDKCDFDKMEKVTKFVYAMCYRLGNTKNILELDTNPEVTSRGVHNLKERIRR
ncbi:M28 family peptidase [candidate division KSB1 bacterium]